MNIDPNLLIAAQLIDEKTCRNCVMYQDGYCNRDGIHADKTKPSYSCRWWIKVRQVREGSKRSRKIGW